MATALRGWNYLPKGVEYDFMDEVKWFANPKRSDWLCSSCVALLLLCAAAAHGANTVTLAWDPNTEDDLVGYRLYYGFSSGDYAVTNDVGNVTNASVTLPVEGKTYYFAVMAYNSLGLESGPSNEVPYAAPVLSTNAAPVPDTAPVPNTVSAETDEDHAVGIGWSDQGPPSAEAIYLMAQPSHGSVIGPASGMTYVPGPNFNGADRFVFIAMETNSTLVEVTALVTVKPVNDPPTLTLPGPITASKQTATSVDGVQVADVDAGSANVTVTFSVGHGTLVLSGSVPGGLTAGQINGSGTASAIATAPMAAINATLGAASGLLYTGNLNFLGSDTLDVLVNDDGHTGSGGAKTATASVSLTVNGTPHDLWLNQHFAQTDLSDANKEDTVWGPLADPDHDGRSNLLEYALGLDPNNGSDAGEGLSTSVVDGADGKHQTLTFKRRKNDSSLVYVPEVSGDMVNWSSGGGFIQQIGTTDLNAEFEEVTVKDLTPLAPGSPRFIRLRVVKD